MQDILQCAKCKGMVIDCTLEDKIRGFGDDDAGNLDKYMPLNTCLRCLEGNGTFILCTKCTEGKF